MSDLIEILGLDGLTEVDVQRFENGQKISENKELALINFVRTSVN